MDQARIHYLDWLKVLIVYGIFVFHVSLVFAVGTWLVSNHQRSIIASAFAGFCFPWGIPAMFLIAGADAWFGLRSHSVREFVTGRIKRLLIPMAVGLAVLSPFQHYVTSHNPPPSIERLWGFYPAMFRSFRIDHSLEWVANNWLHLWFLGYLFGISIACLPVLYWLRKESGRSFTWRLIAVAERRGGLYLLGLPLVLTQLVLRPIFPRYQDWADVATYTFAFLGGAILFSNRGFEPAIRRNIGWFLLTGTIAVLGVGAIFFLQPGPGRISGATPLAVQLLYSFLWALDIWSWLLAVLYLGLRWLDSPGRLLTYTQESVLPFYVIHHPVVLLVASFVVSTSMGVGPKIVVILVAGFALTIAIYEFGVRRFNVTRFLFGLRPLSNDVTAVPSSTGPAARDFTLV